MRQWAIQQLVVLTSAPKIFAQLRWIVNECMNEWFRRKHGPDPHSFCLQMMLLMLYRTHELVSAKIHTMAFSSCQRWAHRIVRSCRGLFHNEQKTYFCSASHSESSFSAKTQPFELNLNFLDRAEYRLQHMCKNGNISYNCWREFRNTLRARVFQMSIFKQFFKCSHFYIYYSRYPALTKKV